MTTIFIRLISSEMWSHMGIDLSLRPLKR
jgi:hypothetical protein